jgi:two-component system LytT family sensor kinase
LRRIYALENAFSRAVFGRVPPTPSRNSWPLLIAVWLVVGLLLTGLLFLEALFPLPAESLLSRPGWIVYTQLARALLWALLTPVVFHLRRRIPYHGWRVVPAAGLHTCFALLFMMWIFTVRLWVDNLVNGASWEDYGLIALLDRFAVRTTLDFVIYWLLLGVGYTVDLHRERQQREVNEAHLEGRIIEAQLGALRQQMHPHFLHNALNAIAELVRAGENRAAVDAIVRLAALQRTLMTSSTDREVPLADELAFIEQYLALERLRFGERLQVEISVPAELQRAHVPALLLQPLVENASKHGISRRIAPGWIRIRASLTEGLLRIAVENDLPEEHDELREPPAKRSGIGLANLKQRLARLYPERNALTLTVDPAAGARVVVEFPFRLSPAS